jgi:hypothetical protein
VDESGHRGIDHIVRVAASSHRRIVDWHGDLKMLADVICEAAIELRGDRLSPEFHRRLFEEIKSEIGADRAMALPPRSFVDYQFADRDPEIAMDQARRQLELECVKLANQLFGLLDHLRSKNIIGTVESGESTCRFSFHSRVAILEQDGPTRKEERRQLDPEFADHWHKAYFVDKFQTTPVSVLHRQCVNVHHVRNPILSEPGQTQHPIPRKYRDLLDAIPDWIRPSLRVLEGDLFREEGIEWDTHRENRPDEKLLSSEWQRCPAIVLGDYVLAGWGEQSIAAEESELWECRVAAETEANTQIARQYDTATRYMGVLAIITMALSVLGGILISFVAIVLGVAAMILASVAARHKRKAVDSPSAEVLHISSVGSVIFGFQSMLFALIFSSIPAFGLAVLFAVMSRFLSNRKHDADQR